MAVGLRATVTIGAAGVLLAFLWLVLSPVRSLRTLPTDPPETTPATAPPAYPVAPASSPRMPETRGTAAERT